MRLLKASLLSCATIAMVAGMNVSAVQAKTVKVTFTAEETTLTIDNKGTKYAAWTYNGSIPGPVVRAKVGDTVDFTLINPKTNKNSHSIDFHAAEVNVLDEFAPVKPGHTKKFKFVPQRAGVYMYHCGAGPMAQHIARGMYGVIIIDPKRGYSKKFPKPDREYVLVQGQYFPKADDAKAMIENRGWAGSLINGKMFNYDPVHDPNASMKRILVSKPGERVRIYFVNANINMPVAFHPIAGIWDRVYLNGSPKNVLYDIQTWGMPVASASIFDIVSPKGKTTANAIVDHTMGAALRGAITVLLNSKDADPKLGRNGNYVVR